MGSKGQGYFNNFLVASVECLSKELAIFAPGIKVLLVEPGYFRTSVFSNVNQAAPHVDFYSEFNAGMCNPFHIQYVGLPGHVTF